MRTNPQSAADTVTRVGREAQENPALDRVVRLGLVSYGVVHVVLAWLRGERTAPVIARRKEPSALAAWIRAARTR